MKDNLIVFCLAALAGGAVGQVRRLSTPIPWWQRGLNVIAGAACAYFATPFIVLYFSNGVEMEARTQYLIAFGVGLFWIEVFDRIVALIGSVTVPFAGGK